VTLVADMDYFISWIRLFSHLLTEWSSKLQFIIHHIIINLRKELRIRWSSFI
jgi:hypothetical protein